jgi:hypothetical protein
LNTWIYQVNPDRFDVNGCLAEAPERVAWVVARYKRDLVPNDQVFVWRSKSHISPNLPGIIAECAIDSFVAKMSADPVTMRFSRDGSPDTVADRVWLRIIAIAAENSGLTEEEIAKHELLNRIGPLSFRNAAIYKISEDQSRALNSLWGGRTKRSTP